MLRKILDSQLLQWPNLKLSLKTTEEGSLTTNNKIIWSNLKCKNWSLKIRPSVINLMVLKRILGFLQLLKQNLRLSLINSEIKLILTTESQKPTNKRFKSFFQKTMLLEMKSEMLKKTSDFQPLKLENSPIN